jgi:hypothetical protein
MSRERRDFEKAQRDERGRASVQSFALDRAEEDELPKSLLDGQKLKGQLLDQVCSQKPSPRLYQVINDPYVIKRLISESRIHVLAQEDMTEGTARCLCEMEIDYAYGHMHLDHLDFLTAALNAIRSESSFKLLFWFKCPSLIFAN